jgi:hypothetical protein
MSQLVAVARLPVAKAFALEAEILDLGAVHINELMVEDWQNLAAWSKLGPFEQRRVLGVLSST